MSIPSSRGTPRRRRWVAAGLALGLAAILIGAATATAAAEPPPPAPVPTGPPVDSCPTNVALPTCAPPTVTVTPTLPGIPAPPTTTTSCSGIGCLPTPTTTPTPSAPPASGGDEDSCGLGGWFTDFGDCAVKAINSWFAGIATSALHPLLDLLGQTLLSTPSLESLPQIGPLWTNSWELVLAGYVVLVLLGGILVMTHHSVQTQVGLKEILPRLLVAFCASALSLWVADQAIVLANALSRAVLGQDIDPSQATGALANLLMVQSMAPNMAFTVLLALGAVALLVGLLVTFVVRAVVTIMLVVAAPLCLACHALPQTDGIARWWWRSFGAVLAIQIAQSLTLVVAIRVFLAPTTAGG
jgi:hypothetical protein